MKATDFVLWLIPIVFASVAQADDLAPGLWEITMESRVPSETGWTPQPFNLTQCLSARDAKDPSALVSSLSTQGASGCNFTERSYSGGTFRFAMECGGAFGLKTRGSMSFGANSFSGSITAIGNLGGQSTEFQNRISGRRLGAC